MPTEGQISEFIGDLAAALPGFSVARSDVLRIMSGTLPARHPGADEVATHDLWIDAGKRDGPKGLFTLVGVKYTTAPLAAKRAVDRIMARCFDEATARESSGHVEPEPRVVPTWPEFETLAREDIDRARLLMRGIVDGESVTSVEDLLLRRSDWGLVPTEFDEAARLALKLYPERFSPKA